MHARLMAPQPGPTFHLMPRRTAPARPKSPAPGALLIAQSMLWMLRRRARRHDGRKFTA